ncbi:MAG: hypothetical protein PVJ67_03790 [Candidatus Pacearchaeota archaeon]|jgi:uncharacterized membrane-anchored protein YhcB (DUF1043 family)
MRDIVRKMNPYHTLAAGNTLLSILKGSTEEIAITILFIALIIIGLQTNKLNKNKANKSYVDEKIEDMEHSFEKTLDLIQKHNSETISLITKMIDSIK